MKVIVEVGYWEIRVRPAKKDEKGEYFLGVGGIFEKHSTLFNNIKSFENYLTKKKFEDNVSYHKDLEQEFLNYYGDLLYGEELNFSDDGEWFTF